MPNYLKTDGKGIAALNLQYQHKHAVLDLVRQFCKNYYTILAVSLLSGNGFKHDFKRLAKLKYIYIYSFNRKEVKTHWGDRKI